MKNYLHSLILMTVFFGASVHASRNGSSAMTGEDYAIISNGQGISSPSFWNGIEGENPAGLVNNQSLKLQVAAGSYSGAFLGSASNVGAGSLGSGGILVGNGMLGSGVDFQEFMNSSGVKQGKINWGLAGRLQPIATTFGLSSHTLLKGARSTYDAGLMIEPLRQIRVGFTVPNFTNANRTIAGGVTYLLDESVEMVVDADYNSHDSCGVVKPGVTLHAAMVQAAIAYGVRFKGTVNELLNQGFTAGLGIKLAQSLLISYEYRGIPDHRVGLTLRFN
jgi:hypothetical protein